MSKAFLASSSEHLTAASTPVTGFPLTISLWFNPDDVTTGNEIISIVDASAASDWISIGARGDQGGDPLRLRVRRSSDSYVLSSGSFSANQWQHACCVIEGTGANQAHIFLDGSKDSGTVSTPINLDSISIGRLGDSSPSNYTNGSLAEIGIWAVALTDAEVACLAAGFAPPLMRPQSLEFYAPLVREDVELIGGLSFSTGGTPTVDDHPRIILPSSNIGVFNHAAAGGGAEPLSAFFQETQLSVRSKYV